ncbi:MAG: DegV family protein [Lachnospiraceae bacterium]
MKKIAIVTDSNSGITQDEAKQIGITVLPMPFYIEGELFFEDINLSQEEFYRKLAEDSDISTSQPSPGDVLELWEVLLKEYDEIVHIPMSSGLSSSCETAMLLSKEFEGKVQVVNNRRISVTQRQAVMDAMKLQENGRTAEEIKKILEAEQLETSIYITVDTLKYLKKGGRITPAAAAIGTVLNLKPVLQIQGERLDAFAKVRGWKQAKKVMLEAMERDLNQHFDGKPMCLQMAYTGSRDNSNTWLSEIQAKFPQYDIQADPLSLSVACHIGSGALAIACSKKVEI